MGNLATNNNLTYNAEYKKAQYQISINSIHHNYAEKIEIKKIELENGNKSRRTITTNTFQTDCNTKEQTDVMVEGFSDNGQYCREGNLIGKITTEEKMALMLMSNLRQTANPQMDKRILEEIYRVAEKTFRYGCIVDYNGPIDLSK